MVFNGKVLTNILIHFVIDIKQHNRITKSSKMPPVGGFVALCAQAHHRPVEIKPSIVGDFSKIEFSPNSDTLKGNLLIHFDTYRICHGGVKVLLKGYLNLNEVNNEKSINVFRPAQTILEGKSIISI